MKSFIFGETVQKQPIIGYQFGSSGPEVLILGGVHGDEIEGVICANALVKHFAESFTYKLQLTIVPMLNADGVLNMQRKNANKIDLNRNLPTQDWTSEVAIEKYYPGATANSEPENQAITRWIENTQTKFIISLHSWKPVLNTNGPCEPEASILSKITGYDVKDSIGYPTPGCLGTYTGLERGIPTITYEIERGLSPKAILDVHPGAIMEALKATEDRT